RCSSCRGRRTPRSRHRRRGWSAPRRGWWGSGPRRSSGGPFGSVGAVCTGAVRDAGVGGAMVGGAVVCFPQELKVIINGRAAPCLAVGAVNSLVRTPFVLRGTGVRRYVASLLL